MPNSYAVRRRRLRSRSILIYSQELEALARDWAKPGPKASFSLRVPVEYASLAAAVSRTFSS
jgi:hypothetical protein